MQNKSQLFTHTGLPGLEALKAHYLNQHFNKHWHESYSIGLILSGVNRFLHKGSQHHATRGSICVVNPHELHTGETCTEDGWHYLNIFPSIKHFELAQQAFERPKESIYFPSSIIHDTETARALFCFASSIMTSSTTLEIEERWLEFCYLILSRHGENKPKSELKQYRSLPRTIKRAREVLDHQFNTNLSLTSLAKICDISPFHLARSFKSCVGLSPHAYQLQQRVLQAKKFIQNGYCLTDAANATGFADQAHMTRCFNRILGTTPSQFK